MKLIYLYVQNYKNIQNQGFNFTTEFKCDYKDGTLTIDKNENYIENFFGENIEVSAIVGENGSGKSSLFEAISLLYYQGTISYDKNDKSFVLFKRENEFYIFCDNYKDLNNHEVSFSNFIKIHNNTQIKSPKIFSARGQGYLVSLFNHCLTDFSNASFFKGLKSYPNYYQGYEIDNFLMTKHDKIVDQFVNKFQYVLKNNAHFFDFLNDDFIFDSYRLEIHFPEIEANIMMEQNEEFKNLISFQKDKTLTQSQLFYKLSMILAVFQSQAIVYKSRNTMFDSDEPPKEKMDKFCNEFIISKVSEYFQEHQFSIEALEAILGICDNALSKIGESYDLNLMFNQSNIDYLIKNYREYYGSENEQGLRAKVEENNQAEMIYESAIYEMKSISIESHFENKFLEYLYFSNIARCDFLYKKFKTKTFLTLSSGEQYYLKVLTNIAYSFLRHKINGDDNSNSYIMLFDEIELSMHPNWQKNIIYSVNSILQKVNIVDNKKIQMIFNTHSPFILSDIPRQNIVFLKDGKQVDALEKKQTFGANIHTLLADGFFMDGGLMGEFAKEKIEDVIKFLNDDSSKIKDKKEAQKIINIIGEPILKNQLQKMLDSKRLDKIDKIDELEDEIEQLKYRIEILRKNQ